MFYDVKLFVILNNGIFKTEPFLLYVDIYFHYF